MGSLAAAMQTSRLRDFSRVSAEKAEHEKLNHERGIKPLPVNESRDGAGSESLPGRIGEELLYSTPRNEKPPVAS